MFYWLLKFVLVGPLMHLLNRPRAEGVENIPTDGPALLAGNHLSFTDWLFTPLMSPRRITYLAKAEYFTGPGLKGRLQKFFFSGTGQYPIDRGSADTAEAALDTARRLLGEGRMVGLYPEGTRSPDGRLYKGKTGVARLALETGVPVIPVSLVGTDEVCPPGPFRWRPRKVTVKFGTPIDFSRYEGMDGNRFVERAVTDEIMYELMRMSGQEYVDVYASSLKDGAADEKGGAAAGKKGDAAVGPGPDADRMPQTLAG